MALQGWNILDTCRSKSCACLNLSGATFVSILGNECDVNNNLPLSLQIYENNTFALRTRVRDVDLAGQEQVALGSWKCCNGIWCGVAIVGISNVLTDCIENVGDHYVRLSLQICPLSNTIRWRRVYFSAPADKCLSDAEQNVTYVGPVLEAQLQRIGNTCAVTDADLKRPQTIVG